MDPSAATPNPAYMLNIPPGRLLIIFPASMRPRDLSPTTFCWTVFMVSNGASIVLEHAAARPEARVFLSPSVTAVDDFLVVDVVVVEADGDETRVRPPRGMLRTALDGLTMSWLMLNSLADERAGCDDRRSSESRSAALILDSFTRLNMAKTLGMCTTRRAAED
mmetsp:Transcript_5762/g.12586  ORF Transcript_5762/g.12586 Transcript_5762/m.12586 type:complete len:164 (+) Transcript_5762:818-1309(+)